MNNNPGTPNESAGNAPKMTSPDDMDTSEGKLLMEKIFLSRKNTRPRAFSRGAISYKSINVISDSSGDEGERGRKEKDDSNIDDQVELEDKNTTGGIGDFDHNNNLLFASPDSSESGNTSRTPIAKRYSTGDLTGDFTGNLVSAPTSNHTSDPTDCPTDNPETAFSKSANLDYQSDEIESSPEQTHETNVTQKIFAQRRELASGPSTVRKSLKQPKVLGLEKVEDNLVYENDVDHKSGQSRASRTRRMRIVVLVVSLFFTISLAVNIYTGAYETPIFRRQLLTT